MMNEPSDTSRGVKRGHSEVDSLDESKIIALQKRECRSICQLSLDQSWSPSSSSSPIPPTTTNTSSTNIKTPGLSSFSDINQDFYMGWSEEEFNFEEEDNFFTPLSSPLPPDIDDNSERCVSPLLTTPPQHTVIDNSSYQSVTMNSLLSLPTTTTARQQSIPPPIVFSPTKDMISQDVCDSAGLQTIPPLVFSPLSCSSSQEFANSARVQNIPPLIFSPDNSSSSQEDHDLVSGGDKPLLVFSPDNSLASQEESPPASSQTIPPLIFSDDCGVSSQDRQQSDNNQTTHTSSAHLSFCFTKMIKPAERDSDAEGLSQMPSGRHSHQSSSTTKDNIQVITMPEIPLPHSLEDITPTMRESTRDRQEVSPCYNQKFTTNCNSDQAVVCLINSCALRCLNRETLEKHLKEDHKFTDMACKIEFSEDGTIAYHENKEMAEMLGDGSSQATGGGTGLVGGSRMFTSDRGYKLSGKGADKVYKCLYLGCGAARKRLGGIKTHITNQHG